MAGTQGCRPLRLGSAGFATFFATFFATGFTFEAFAFEAFASRAFFAGFAISLPLCFCFRP